MREHTLIPVLLEEFQNVAIILLFFKKEENKHAIFMRFVLAADLLFPFMNSG